MRQLLKSKAFVRRAKKLIKKSPQIVEDIATTLELWSEDAFQPILKTHKLKGHLEDSWACSAGYDLRIVFEFVQHEGEEAILLEDIGTHDDVYWILITNKNDFNLFIPQIRCTILSESGFSGFAGFLGLKPNQPEMVLILTLILSWKSCESYKTK